MQLDYYYDVVIVGTGSAGLKLALHLNSSLKVALLSKSTLQSGASWQAQGGIAAVLNPIKDSYEKHIEDTLIAGAGLCQKEIVEDIVKHGTKSINFLIKQGVPFTLDSNEHSQKLHLTREGGHSERRIIHAADATGKAVSSSLIEKVKRTENIDIFEHHIAIDLIINVSDKTNNKKKCIGLYVLDIQNDKIKTFHNKIQVLASGGASRVYLYSSHEESNSGDGIAMAWRAGCKVANMEFNQFHPTCLYHQQAGSFLISEAVRGEGGKLIRPDGSSFMANYDSREELAPRDIVARAIDYEMKRLGVDCMYLDISHKNADFLKYSFPNIYQRCLGLGIDITKVPIPIVPAAHYTCGGIVVDVQGKTDIDHLLAIGECAYTGLHGANRLASNSLLECLVMAEKSSDYIHQNIADIKPSKNIIPWDESQVIDPDEKVIIAHNWDEIRRFMWDYVGIVRTNKRLLRAQHRVKLLQSEINDFYSNFKVCRDLIELRNLALIAQLIIESALCRKESIGLHFSLDYQKVLSQSLPTILKP